MRRLTILMFLAGALLTCHARTLEQIQKELLGEQYTLSRCQVIIADAETSILRHKLDNMENPTDEEKQKRLADIKKLQETIGEFQGCAARIGKRIDTLLKELDALPNPSSTQLPERQKARALGGDVRAKLDALTKRLLKAESDLRALSKNVNSTSNNRKAGK
jgi:peptidoglycan hydrolase CwlO-like protein